MLRAELFPFFDAMSNSVREELRAQSVVRAEPHRQLLRRGDPAGGAYLVLSGSLRVYYITSEGREATLYRVDPGGTCILALSSTLAGQAYPAWVQAGMHGATFTRINPAALQRYLDTETSFRRFVLGAMSNRIFELMGRLEDVASATVTERVAAYLLQYADAYGRIRITQGALAAELGTAREVVFRALKTLTGRGFITTRRGAVHIENRPALTLLAPKPGS